MKIDLTVAGYAFNDEGKLLLILHTKLNKWLPVGGHIDSNEIPDDALKREFQEEVRLDIDFLDYNNIREEKGVVNLARPFHVNMHNVGDHEHVCFFYLCKVKGSGNVTHNHELQDYHWHTKLELMQRHMPIDVREIGLLAFELMKVS